MRREETAVAGAFVIEIDAVSDERGLFARTFDHEQFVSWGLDPRVAQCNISFNPRKGTLRGMHFQAEPHQESKLVRCTMGAIYDVIIDVRRASPTFRRWYGVELTAAGRRMMYVPEGCAHGLITLTDDAEVSYQMNIPYAEQAGRGVRWDDPAFGVIWPIPPVLISDRDRLWPLWDNIERDERT